MKHFFRTAWGRFLLGMAGVCLMGFSIAAFAGYLPLPDVAHHKLVFLSPFVVGVMMLVSMAALEARQRRKNRKRSREKEE